MKTKFNNRELCHVYAQQSQRAGSGSSMYFQDGIIYSYGQHFPIACFHTLPASKFVLFTSRGYSSTTAKHKSYVMGALTGKVLVVPCVLADTIEKHLENTGYLVQEIELARKKALSALKHGASYQDSANELLEDLAFYVEAFKGQFDISPAVKALLKLKGKLFTKTQTAKIEANIKASKIAEAKARKAKTEAEAVDLARWVNGEAVQRSFYNSPVRLRISGDMVETTKGAKVTLTEARLLWASIQQGRDVQGFKIDYYTVQGIKDGYLVAGCHSIEMQEINRIGALL